MSVLKGFVKKIKKISNISLLLVMFLAFNLTAVLGLVFAKENKALMASTIAAESVSVTNPSFSSYSGSSPRTPTSWTKIHTDSSLISGVIDIDDADKDSETLKLKEDIEKYEGMSEDYVLLMNSPETVSQMGYKSSEFTLLRNSYYVVTFKAYVENGAYGSCYIAGADIDKNIQNYVNFTTHYEYEKDDGNGGTETVKTAVWKDCYVLVKTNKYFDIKANLELRLGNALAGSKGAVLYDNVQIYKYAELDYETIKAATQTNDQCVFYEIVLDKELGTLKFEENFENKYLTNWEKSKDCDADNEKALSGYTYLGAALNQSETGITDSVSNQGLANNKGAFFVNNTEKLSVSYKLKTDNYFNIEQNELYLLTFDAFTGTISGDGATQAKIYAENSENEFELVATLDKISTEKKWKTYAFAINSNGFKNTKAYLELGLDKAQGYALFDNVKLYKVSSYEIYNKYLTTNTETCKEADVSFVKTTSLNNYFNKTYKFDVAGILSAQKWTNTKYDQAGNTLAKDDNTVCVAGVVNTNNWVGLPFANPGDPNYNYYSTTSNNILVLNNINNGKQTMKSESFTITKSKNYEICVDVRTYGNAKAGIKVCSSDGKTLYENFEISNSEWTTYTINIVGGNEDTTVYFELSLGEKEALTGVAFFDNLYTNEIGASDNTKSYSETFNNVTENNVLDLSKNNFANVDTLSLTDGIYTARNWSYTKQAKVNAGVVDTLKFGDVAKTFAVKNPNLPTQIKNANSKVFMIDSAFDSYYTVAANNKIKLDLSSYYKVSFWVLTNSIPQNDESLEYNYGASIKVIDSSVKLGETFTGINTNGEWKEYVLYLNTLTNDEAVENYNLSVTLALGQENLRSSGTVFFSEIVTAKIEQTEFDNVVKEQETNVDDSIITFVGSTKAETNNTETPEEEPKEESSNDVSLSFLHFSTILTAVVILLAVIAFAIKSLNIKRPVRIKAADLNKERMSARNFAFKDKMIEINNRLAVLDDELFETNIELDEELAARNVNTQKVEELKAKKANIVQNMKEIKQEEKELVEQFKKFKKDERLRKNRSKNK